MNAVVRNNVVQERRTASPVGVAGFGVVDDCVGGAQIACAHRGCRDGDGARRKSTVVRPLIADEVKDAILEDWPTEAAAILVIDELRYVLPGRLEIRARLAPVTHVIPEASAVNIV